MDDTFVCSRLSFACLLVVSRPAKWKMRAWFHTFEFIYNDFEEAIVFPVSSYLPLLQAEDRDKHLWMPASLFSPHSLT